MTVAQRARSAEGGGGPSTRATRAEKGGRAICIICHGLVGHPLAGRPRTVAGQFLDNRRVYNLFEHMVRARGRSKASLLIVRSLFTGALGLPQEDYLVLSPPEGIRSSCRSPPCGVWHAHAMATLDLETHDERP